jgi:lipopolysaccharide biosynthesis regulator YciM
MFKEIKTSEQVAQEKAQQEQEQINNESREYLKSTDWYVIRQQETSVAIPQDILDARQAARESII